MKRRLTSGKAEPAENQDGVPEDDVEMDFFDHLGELRTRVIRAVYGLLPGVAFGWIFREEILGYLVMPFQEAWLLAEREGDPKLIFLNPIDPVVAYLKIAVIVGLLVGAPWVFYQLWAFLSPGLYRREKKMAIPFVIVSTLFFLAGTSFGYVIVFPIAFQYFLEFAVTLPSGIAIEPTIAINEILNFEVRMLLAFGIVFELPVVTSFLAAAGIVDWKQLLAFSRWWAVIAAGLSALLTPPDPGSMLMMLVPLLVLWFISVGFAAIIGRKKPEPEPL